MRRFENQDEEKFWQIEIVSGSSPTVKWSFGKIGAKGQTKIKKCTTTAEAESEVNRLVGDKVKQGFEEIGAAKATVAKPAPAAPAKSAPAALPAPPAAPPPAPPPIATMGDRIFWTEAAKKLDLNRLGVNAPPLPEPSVAEEAILRVYASMKEDWRLALMRWRDAGTDPVRLELEAYIAASATKKTTLALDLDKEAMLATLTRHDARGPFVARWLASPGGIETALAILARMWGYYQAYAPSASVQRQSWLVLKTPADNWDSSVCAAKMDVVEMLARHVRALGDQDRAKARAIAAKLRDEGAPLTVRIGLARAVDDADFGNEDARELLTTMQRPFGLDAKFLMRLVSEMELLEALVDQFKFDYLAFRPEIVARRVGLPVAPLLGKQLEKAGSRSYEVDVATYLATLECAETARILSASVGKKGVDVVAKEFFHRRPDLSFSILGAEIAGSKSKLALVLEPLLRSLLVANPTLFEKMTKSGKLEPKVVLALRGLGAIPEEPANKQIAGADEDVVDGAALFEIAEPSALPGVLVDPPWLATVKEGSSSSTRVTAPPVIEGLKLLPFEEKILMSKEEHAVAMIPPVPGEELRRWSNVPAILDPRTPMMDEVVLPRLLSATEHISAWFDLMSDEAARKYFDEDPRVNARDIRVETRDVLYLLARFGLESLPFIFALGKHSSPRQVCEALIVVASPRVGAFMGEIAAKEKGPRRAALAYFEEHSEACAIGLLPAALSKKTSPTAQRHAIGGLQLFNAQKPDVVRSVAERYGEKVSAALDRLLEWQGPTRAGGVTRTFAPPWWFDPRTLPPILLAKKKKNERLPNSAVIHLATLLTLGESDAPHPRLHEVVAACTRTSLARWAWSVFQTWLSEGAEPKDDWALIALGELGDDDVARRLSPLLRAWPGEAHHARAVKGLDVLARIGSDVALMNLDAIAEKVKFKALQERARNRIEEVAKGRKLSREELADRIAPTLDLDPDGSRVISMGVDGKRNYRVGFDENLVPFVIDEETGKRSADLPKARASDDAGAAAEAAQTWKALKKDAKAIGSTQILRLERAMIMQRRWTGRELKTLFIAHPLVFHLVRRLVWGIFDRETNDLTTTFRVAEDRTLASVDDDAFDLADEALVGLPHRLEMTDADARKWGELFGSYEILQPFPQLSREVYERTEEEAAMTMTVIRRLENVEVSTRRVLGLTSRGWKLGMVQDAGWIWSIDKPLSTTAAATMSLEGGLYVAAMAESPTTQKLGPVTCRSTVAWNVHSGAPPPITFSRIVFSELIRDLESLRG